MRSGCVAQLPFCAVSPDMGKQSGNHHLRLSQITAAEQIEMIQHVVQIV